MAIELGIADVMVVWRARNRGSGTRPWMKELAGLGQNQFHWPHGLIRPVDGIAMQTRYMIDRYGWPPELLGSVAINNRDHAARNPSALMRTRITMEDYLASRWISEPLRLFDCCLETDGALAIVMVAAERAPDLPQDPVYVTGFGLGSMPQQYAMTSYYGPKLEASSARYVAQEVWKNTALKPSDMDVIQFYDAFTPEIPMQFEEYGFCGEGEAADYLLSGAHVPYNTSGGGLSEAYVHGFNLIVEGVRQVRGESSSQVPEVSHCLVTGGNVVPTGAIVFSSEPS